MKTILLHVHDDAGQEARLQASLDLARATGGHIVCAQITPLEYFVGTDPFGGMYAVKEVLANLRTQETVERARIEARLATEGVSWDWRQFDGNVVQTLVSYARLADVVVLSQPRRGSDPLTEPIPVVSDVAIHARAPVLSVPAETRSLDVGGKAMVAWGGSYEAAHALRFALPLLRLAGSVHLVEITDETREFPSTAAAEYLSRHGIAAEMREIPHSGRDTGAALLDEASTLGAGYLVMGAYGHSRLREMMLGGVTRKLLGEAPIPLLMAH
ncbi:universal stress protein [Sphingomonas sp. LaA6.9]|uniref:universal stress protein n=1 Tax=Sphingomonas sp. LaA6.9 TaxID=2919914 RepID=UPI001F4FA4B9|nr:universal stress protein [Sphingomonas sp. LaA6.9]MCJ8157763.1 universal stress protein [Sphingomonas sp. LaA6.9]